MSGRNFWIEGIGDDALYAFAAFFGSFVPIMIMVFRRGNFIQNIHPENAANVEATRQEVNQQRANHQGDAQNGAGHHGHQQTQQPIRENHGQHDCPICLATAEYAVQTNCGHIFCGLCITTYWHHGRWLGAVSCPVCRQRVNILLINFTRDEHNSNAEERRTVVDAVYDYNRRFSGEPRPWQDYLRDLPTLLQHAMAEFFSVGGLIWMFRFRILVCFLAALLYFVSPFDIIPEAVFGVLGFLDDLFVLLLLAIYISLIYRNVIQQRANNANRVQQ